MGICVSCSSNGCCSGCGCIITGWKSKRTTTTLYKSIFKTSENGNYRVALKNPHGFHYIYYDNDNKKFISGVNVQTWLSELYIGHTVSNQYPWTHWILYNDEPPLIYDKSNSTFIKPKTTAGHCKGILAWNEYEMSWLIHSVPCFPDFFRPDASGGIERVFSEMRHSEEIYGQSFGYFYLSWEKEGKEVGEKRMTELLAHIRVMEPCIYMSKGFWDTSYSEGWAKGTTSPPSSPSRYQPHYPFRHTDIAQENVAGLHRWIGVPDSWEHYAKSPHWEEEFYEELAMQKGGCRVESWIRGQRVENSDLVTNNECVYSLKPAKRGKMEVWKFMESQDHSKWAVSVEDGSQRMVRDVPSSLIDELDTETERPWVMIGDLNRMHSQKKRGGGGAMIFDKELRHAWNLLLYKS
jgi:deoxyribonuclease-2